MRDDTSENCFQSFLKSLFSKDGKSDGLCFRTLKLEQLEDRNLLAGAGYDLDALGQVETENTTTYSYVSKVVTADSCPTIILTGVRSDHQPTA